MRRECRRLNQIREGHQVRQMSCLERPDRRTRPFELRSSKHWPRYGISVEAWLKEFKFNQVSKGMKKTHLK